MDISIANINTVSAVATVPRFVRSVYDMLQNEDQRILSWSADGSHFQVYDVPRLEAEVLRKYFKHGKFSSFQRQLNNFGFHKWTKTRASVATFSHDVLVQCHPSQLTGLVSHMKLNQKAVTTASTSQVKATTSTKRPRSLLPTATTDDTASLKKRKTSPRDVCAVDDLSHISVPSILEPLWLLVDDSSWEMDDLLLLDALDSVELVALGWDAVVSPVEMPLCLSNEEIDSDCVRITDVDGFDFELDCAATTDLEAEADVSVVDSGLPTAQSLTDVDFDALLEAASDVTIDVAIDVDVDTLLFV